MARLEGLQVQGIRSFNPSAPERITFYPLTLILGANGAGKTTLIECLRYAATNDFPPQTNRGKTWVHDIQCTNSHTIKSQVKLKFKDIKGEECVLTRSLELVAKRDRSSRIVPQLRTLDAIIQREGKNLVSSKCAEIDHVMLDLLGVSKSVLSDVIFCHQEDSNWPLSESKILKEKFDQLFGSMGYVKALKRIKDDRNDYVSAKKECEGELRLFAEQKEQNEVYMKELNKNEANLRMLKEQAAQFTSELQPIADQLSDITKKEKKIIDIEKEISLLEGQCNGLKTTIKQLKRTIREPFKGNETELRKQIDEFISDISTKKEKLNSDQEELTSVETKLTQMSAKMNKISVCKGKLEAKQAKFKDDIEKLRGVIKRIPSELNANVDELLGKIDSDLNAGMQAVTGFFRSQELTLEKKSEELIQKQEASLKKIDASLDDLKSMNSRLEQSIKLHEESKKEKELELEELKDILGHISESSSQLELISQEIGTKKEELSSLEQKNSLRSFESEIDRLRQKIAGKKGNLDRLRKEKDDTQTKSQNLAVLKVHKENKKKALDVINDIEFRQEQFLKEFDIDSNDSERSFLDELKAKANKIQRRVLIKERDFEEKLADKQKLDSQLSIEKMKLVDMKKDIKEKEKKIYSICESDSYPERVKAVDSQLKNLRALCANSSGAQFLLSEFVEVIEKETRCPLCKRSFNDKKECQNVVKAIKTRIDKIPLEATQTNEKLEELEQQQNQLMSLKSDYEFVENSKNVIANLNKNISKFQEKVDDSEVEVDKLQKDLKRDRSEVEKIRAAQPDALSYDSNVRILNECEQAIKKLNHEISPDDEDARPVEEITEEIEKVSSQLETLESEIEKLQKERNEVSTAVSSLKEELLKMENQRLELQKGQQNEVTYRNKISELKEQVKDCVKLIEKTQRELQILKPRVDKAVEEKTRQQKLDKHEYKELECLISKVKRCHDEYKNISSDIKKYSEDDISFEMDNIVEEFDEIQGQISALQSKKMDLTKSLQLLSKNVNEAELVERNLKDNLDLMQRTVELESLMKEVEEKTKAKGAPDVVGVLQKKQKLERAYHEKDRALQQCKGKQDPIVSRCRELKTELEKDKYKKAADNYSKKLLEVMELDAICEDLNKLYKALDHSVMVFHHRKMEEINRYLYKLWKQAYRGNDIDYIKIMSDSEGGLASDKRRSFNYRVVMVRQKVEMDMRGRCSAGQKVIASLVMRLALAEIFSVNCGILTLDEPTTNLDKDNIQAFADSIVSIVRSHRNRNFQLIIITHDEQFLKCLKDSDVEFYYCVEKDNKGFSRITKLSIKEKDD